MDVAKELDAWRQMFTHGSFLFDDEPMVLGLPNEPNRCVIEAAWHRLGARFIAEHGRTDDYRRAPLWAIEQFGEPHAG